MNEKREKVRHLIEHQFFEKEKYKNSISTSFLITRYRTHCMQRIFIVYLGVPCSWYTPDYFLQMSKMNKWANEQTFLQFYSFKKISKHFYYKMSKQVNEQNVHMSKFGVKWTPEILIYYKNTPGCVMLMVHPAVPCSWYTRLYHDHGTPDCTMSELLRACKTTVL